MTDRTTEYAGALYRTPYAADMAAIDDFLTACGHESYADTLNALADDREFILDELQTAIRDGDWAIPNEPNPTRELLDDLVSEWEKRAREEIENDPLS